MLTDAVEELVALKLGPMAARLKQWTDDARNRGKSHAECVLALAQAQTQAVIAERTKRFVVRAQLPNAAAADVWVRVSRGLSPEQFGNLVACDWVQRGQTVVITGECESGKTYLAAALAREAMTAGFSVEYRRVPELLQECAVEKAKGKLPSFLKRMSRVALLVLDDFATETADAEQSHILRRLLDGRTRLKKAVMVASPASVEDWDGFFADETAADAIFSRLLREAKPVVLKKDKGHEKNKTVALTRSRSKRVHREPSSHS